MAKKKKEQYRISPIGNKVLDYSVYVMKPFEWLLYTCLIFVAGGLMGQVFFGNLFKSGGQATAATKISNTVVFIVFGLIIHKMFWDEICKILLNKRKKVLQHQFRDFLDAFSTALSSGMNTTNAIKSSYNDLVMQYSENAYISREVNEIIAGMNNNISIRDMMIDFGERSGIDDIRNFAIVFSVAAPTGGNIANVVRRTNDIISEKIMISEEIATAVTSNKLQMNIMYVIPVIMVELLRLMSSQFSDGFASPLGVAGMSVAVVIFFIAIKVGTKITDIKG